MTSAAPDLASPTPPVPRHVRLLDAAILAALAVGALVLIFGGTRLRYDTVSVSMLSPWRPLLLAAALVAVRYAVFRQVTPAERLRRAWHACRHDAAVREAWRATLAIRVPVLAAAFFAVLIIGYPPGYTPSARTVPNELVNLPYRWDAGWYVGIAIEGYEYDPGKEGQQNIAFFPAYPMLMRTAAGLLGARQAPAPGSVNLVDLERRLNSRTLLAGWFVSLGASVWALVYLFRFARDTLGPQAATGSVWLLSAFPFAYFFGALYTESLYLLGALAAVYHFRRHEYLAAALWGLLVGLTRPNGCFLSVPLGVMALQQAFLPGTLAAGDPAPRPGWASFARSIVVAAMPGVGMVLFSAWLWTFTSHPIAWMQAHAAWGRTFQSVDTLFVQRLETLRDAGLYVYVKNQPVETLYVLALLGSLASVWPVARRLGLGYAVLILVTILPPLFAGGFLSMGRITSTLFPVFVYLGWRLSPAATPRVAMSWVALQGMLAAAFFTWREVF